VIKSRPTATLKRYQPTPRALLGAAFRGACIGALIAFALVKLWSIVG
jgi:hypothetical protein